MELRVLRYFLAVADEGSITAAAARVHVSQPSVSRQLRALEQELGVELFVRSGRTVRMSPAGRRFLPIARDLVARADGARATMAALATGSRVELTVAAHPTTIADVIAPFVAGRRDLSAAPTFVAASADEAYDLLSRAEADLAISVVVPPPAFASVELARFPVWAQVAPAHSWANHDAVPLELLLTERLIVPDATHGTRRVFDAVVGAVGGAYELRAEVAVPRIGQALAAAGEGVAIVSDDPTYDLRGLRIDGPDGPLHIVLHAAWGHAHYAAATIRAFAALLREYCIAAGASPDPEHTEARERLRLPWMR